MTNKNQTKRTLLMSIMALILCFTMLLGTTYAWFTDSVTSSGNKIVSGSLKVDLEVLDEDNTTWTSVKESNAAIFNYSNWEPGYTQVKVLRVANEGSLALKWYAKLVSTNGVSDLANVIDVYVKEDVTAYPTDRNDLTGWTCVGTLMSFINSIESTTTGTLEAYTSESLGIAFKMQESAGNEYQEMTLGEFDIIILATQLSYENDSFGSDYDANAQYPSMVDIWDGTYDISWYTQDPNATEYTLSTAEALVGLAALIDGSAEIPADVESEITLPVTFEGKTVKLTTDVDLYAADENGEAICFDPIGSYRQEKAFSGTFDGQGHTIKNLSQNTWALNNGYHYGDLGLGLFSCIENATVKNLMMDNANIWGETALVGFVAATAYGDCTFENITVTNSKGADYQYYAGGIVGWASGNHQYINCNIDSSTTIAAQWGDFDNSTGGIIGGAGGSAKIFMKDCNVACRIDAYNDVTSANLWYAYRRCGMLIGNTGKTTTNENGTTVAAAPQLTCENVTVTYGEWANYTYCEFAGTSYPYVRVQEGISNSAYSNPRYGHPTDANGNTVVDDNHVHNEGEDHFILCVFDQLYGGGTGVYGTATHDNVTVIYNNK